jgi:hypothetical protein
VGWSGSDRVRKTLPLSPTVSPSPACLLRKKEATILRLQGKKILLLQSGGRRPRHNGYSSMNPVRHAPEKGADTSPGLRVAKGGTFRLASLSSLEGSLSKTKRHTIAVEQMLPLAMPVTSLAGDFPPFVAVSRLSAKPLTSVQPNAPLTNATQPPGTH